MLLNSFVMLIKHCLSSSSQRENYEFRFFFFLENIKLQQKALIFFYDCEKSQKLIKIACNFYDLLKINKN